MKKEEKARLKKEYIQQEMEKVKTEDFSVEEYNKTMKEVNTLAELEEGEELPYMVSRFCQEYVIHYNEEKAAQKAGVPIWNASGVGQRLLSDPKVKREIERLQKQVSQKLQITQERVLSEYAKLAYHNIQDFYDEEGNLKSITELDRDTAAAISGLDFGTKVVKDKDGNEKTEAFIKKLSTVNKKDALDALSKHLGLFDKDTDRQIPVDFKTLLQMLPPEVRDEIRVGLAKRIGNKK